MPRVEVASINRVIVWQGKETIFIDGQDGNGVLTSLKKMGATGSLTFRQGRETTSVILEGGQVVSKIDPPSPDPRQLTLPEITQ